MHEMLVDRLIKDGTYLKVYCEAVREFTTPPDWSRLQSPTNHRRSYSYNQYGLITQMNPFIIKMVLKKENIQTFSWNTLKADPELQKLMKDNNWSVLELIVYIYTFLPRIMFQVFVPRKMTNNGKDLDNLIAKFMKLYVRLVSCVHKKQPDIKDLLNRSNLHCLLHIIQVAQRYSGLRAIKYSADEVCITACLDIQMLLKHSIGKA